MSECEIVVKLRNAQTSRIDVVTAFGKFTFPHYMHDCQRAPDFVTVLIYYFLYSVSICRRVQPYVVSGPIPISHSEHTSLRRIVKTSTETVNNENDYHDDSHVI